MNSHVNSSFSTLINSHVNYRFSTLVNSHLNSRFSNLVNSHVNSRFSTLINSQVKSCFSTFINSVINSRFSSLMHENTCFSTLVYKLSLLNSHVKSRFLNSHKNSGFSTLVSSRANCRFSTLMQISLLKCRQFSCNLFLLNSHINSLLNFWLYLIVKYMDFKGTNLSETAVKIRTGFTNVLLISAKRSIVCG